MEQFLAGDRVLVADDGGLALLELDAHGHLIDSQGRISSDESARAESPEQMATQVAAWLRWATRDLSAQLGWTIHRSIRQRVEELTARS